MTVGQQNDTYGVTELFVTQIGTELKRAERYRIFVSLTVLDLGFLDGLMGEIERATLIRDIYDLTRQKTRGCDAVSVLDNHRLCVLFPETPRQGAEAAAKRIHKLVTSELSERLAQTVEQIIPMELASYPDAAGARTITQFLEEIQVASQN